MTEWLKNAWQVLSEGGGAGWVSFALMVLIACAAGKGISRMQRRLIAHRPAQTQVIVLLSKILKGIIWALVLIQGLHGVGVDLISILGAAGVAGVAIGFASQTALSNLISGAFLVGERSFKMGDYIQVSGEEGTVENINLLSVYLRKPDNSLVRIPCETLIKTPVRNLTGDEMRRIDFDLGVDYSCDLTQVKKILLDVIEAQPLLLTEPEPTVTFSGFGASSLNLHIGAWCKTAQYHSTRYEFATAILKAFAEHGIDIPFPIQAVTTYKSTENPTILPSA